MEARGFDPVNRFRPALVLSLAACKMAVSVQWPPSSGGDGDSATGPIDTDGDGYDSSVDCDDNNPTVNPGATEDPTNGIDDDCDGRVDEVVACADGTGEALTIQQAVEMAPDGGTVEICAGRWDELVVVDSRKITITGDPQAMPGDTVVDARAGGPAFTFTGSETTAALRWLSIQGDDPSDKLVYMTDAVDLTMEKLDLSDDGDGLGMAGTIFAEDGEHGGQVTLRYSRLRGNVQIDLASPFMNESLIGNDIMVSPAEWQISVASGQEAAFRNNIVSGSGIFQLYVERGDARTEDDAPGGAVTIANNVFTGLTDLYMQDSLDYAGSDQEAVVCTTVVENNIIYSVNITSDFSPFIGFKSNYHLYGIDGGCAASELADLISAFANNVWYGFAYPGAVGRVYCSDPESTRKGPAEYAAALAAGWTDTDPLFNSDPNTGSFTPSSGSPCIDGGTGDPDPDGSPADIGAFGGPDGNWWQEYPWSLE